MAGADRMAIEEVVRKVLADEHADVLRESVEWLARQLMEVEDSELIGARAWRATTGGSRHASQWLSGPAVGDQGGGDRVADPQVARGQLFPELPAAAQALGAGVGERGPAGLCVRREHPPG